MTGEADSALHQQARRLTLAAELTHRAGRMAAGAAEPAGGVDPLVALARCLAGIAAPVARAHRLTFSPPYPGVTRGVEELDAGRRLVLACDALGAGGTPEAVVFTTLIAGRPPQVAAAPPGTPVPAGWAALAPG